MPELDGDLGLDDEASVSKSEVDKKGEYDSYSNIKAEILEPYARWIRGQNRVVQLLIIFFFIPFLLGFFHHTAVILAEWTWRFK